VHRPELEFQLVPEASRRVEAHERLNAARDRLEGRPKTRFEVRGAFSAGLGLHEEAERSRADRLVVGSSHRGAIGRA
jgi:nucleotide-binding universal stress UspA family protein